MSKELVQGVDHIYLFRIKGETGNAWKVAFQTDGETSEEREYETTPTKDGSIKAAGTYEATHSISSLLAKDDEIIPKITELVRAKNPGRLEVWELDRSDIEDVDTLTIPGEYSTDAVTSISRSSGSEESVEIEIETEVEGYITSGEVKVTESLKTILKSITEEQSAFEQPTDEV